MWRNRIARVYRDFVLLQHAPPNRNHLLRLDVREVLSRNAYLREFLIEPHFGFQDRHVVEMRLRMAPHVTEPPKLIAVL